jgi:hypothetical protein
MRPVIVKSPLQPTIAHAGRGHRAPADPQNAKSPEDGVLSPVDRPFSSSAQKGLTSLDLCAPGNEEHSDTET